MRDFNEDHTPLAYLITFRCYGTWLHGDERGSVDRRRNRYGAPLILPNPTWRQHNTRSLKQAPVEFTNRQRALVKTAIKQTCEIRSWLLRAVNVRTNHVHVVVSAAPPPGRILNGLKANATRELRKARLWSGMDSPWSDGGSKRYLWTEQQVQRAIEYVEFSQGDVFPTP